MRIPSGVVDQGFYFVGVDSIDTVTRETGFGGTGFTVVRSRNGASDVTMSSPTISEIDSSTMPGVYFLLCDEDMTIDTGDDTQEMCFHISHSGMLPVTRVIELYRPKITAGETVTASSGSANAAVQSVANNAITAAAIATGAIDADAIADGAIDTGSIASGAITSTKFGAGAITSTVMANDAITAAVIATGAIDADAIADGAIDAGSIASGAITSAKFGAGAINSTVVADNTITAGKFDGTTAFPLKQADVGTTELVRVEDLDDEGVFITDVAEAVKESVETIHYSFAIVPQT